MRFVAALSILIPACLALAGDQPQYGQRGTRNMVSDEKGLVDGFDPGQRMAGTREVLAETARNVRWAVRTGSETYGGPIVAGGKYYIGNGRRAFFVFQHGKDMKLLNKIDIGPGVMNCPVAANGRLFVASQENLFCVETKGPQK